MSTKIENIKLCILRGAKGVVLCVTLSDARRFVLLRDELRSDFMLFAANISVEDSY